MPKRSPESEVLLLCARQTMAPPCAERVISLCRDSEFRWDWLFRGAAAHEVAALVLTNLLKLDRAAERMKPAIATRWKNAKIRNMLAKQHQARIIGQIVGFFSSRSRRVMLVKGAALDVAVYQQPWYTQSADADLLVDRSYYELSSVDRVALQGILSDWHIELEFTRHHDVDMNRVLDIDYTRVWADAIAVPLGRSETYIMCPEDMLLVACINLCRKRFQQLKGMMAIREIVARYPSIPWENLARNSIACGAGSIVYAALTISALVLGCEIPGGALAALRVGFARRWAIQRQCRSVASYLFQIPSPSKEPASKLLASHLLRVATYSMTQFKREVSAQIDLSRFRAIRAEAAPAG